MSSNKPKQVGIGTLGIVGVGLIGGSLALALKAKKSVTSIIGFGRNRERLHAAKQRHIIDDFACDYSRIGECDAIVVCVPVRTMPKVLASLKTHLTDSVIITDVGSVKGYVVEQAKEILGEYFPQFVPGHPIAGTERSGYEAAFETLYHERRVILTPTEDTSAEATAKVSQMWHDAGAQVVEMPVLTHDDVLAATSHLPHLLAFGLVDCLAQLDDHDAIFKFAAGGFRDFTRIASSDINMWRDIAFTNKTALVNVLDTYQQHMNTLKDALLNSREDEITKAFENAKNARAEYLRKFEPGTNYKKC